jgi:endonuclease III
MTTREATHDSRRPIDARSLVELLGPHPATIAAIDLSLADDAALARWLWLATLLSSRATEEASISAFRRLERASTLAPTDLAKTDPNEFAAQLAADDFPRPEVSAHLLHRLASTLVDRHAGSLTQLASECDEIADLGQRLVNLASGFGAGAASRFLHAVRVHWTGEDELPLDANARAAAAHLGWIDESDDMADGATLRSALARVATPDGEFESAPCDRDVEAALERLGQLACRRGRARGCPLASACAIADEAVHE